MLIHEAAAATGLTIDAIRYYEREHLLDERHITRRSSAYSISSTPAHRAIRSQS
jgi:DNA-binding transcriptional MerR regulator